MPVVELVTSTLIVHIEPKAAVPPLSVTEVPPSTAVRVPPQPLTLLTGVARVIAAGNVSV